MAGTSAAGAVRPEAQRDLPRLAVVSDVDVARTAAGMLLLYRLLREYPADRLRVVYNPAVTDSDSDRRIAGVRYDAITYSIPRAVRNRLNPAWPAVMARLARRRADAVAAALGDFRPQAILTVSHWYLWFAAAELASRLRVPLHLVLHDDWAAHQTNHREGRVHDLARWIARREMKRVYRQAKSRLCVSPGMEEQYADWFGPRGTVLYPSRGDDSPAARVRVRMSPAAGPAKAPVAAFCGIIHGDGTAVALRRLAEELAPIGGRIDFYTPRTTEQLAALGLVAPVCNVVGFLPPSVMAERLGESAHALLLPASFEANERADLSTLFPSKLADYTAVGLPVVAWGPRYSSAVRWAAANPDAAVIVDEPGPARVREALVDLASHPDRASRIAAAAVTAGDRDFDLRSARATLFAALTGG